ncbi:hypothetical protein HUA74_21110 [Myxococcus sp. CA051A]|uniref:Uncharacterized protein n=1 Tax=Myxococcus llanfairpwllgwyngyllgogerychwyrndrobwllllantysiliogogogochensis TaxID=2590453 RepID=A0A540WQH2_9BACT|nr:MULTISPECIES: hypothetical protein [Myxococcus]NTX50207.1 hypothetical protein [Myxococcus sp. CA039A]NTX63153.1 hypothetical protein [Myxococcus sp. CA051A]TQF11263.1 hypothetical protein FJV41_35225 [Myxococcus llanfairpwllgwyngyllgogerychwyrndrobwllllantysiliogogogochensis]
MPQTERLQASLPAFSMRELTRLSKELGVDKSTVVQEALSLFSKAALEARQGSRLVFLPSTPQGTVREFSTPLLTHMEQTAQKDPSEIVLPDADFDRVVTRLGKPSKPTAALRALARKRRRP